MTKALSLLQQYYGYDAFRSQQADIIDSAVTGQDVLVIMPTGGGKSVCYQIPALLRKGTGLVISPLIALMHDQVTALNAMGIRAAYLNSQLSGAEANKVIQQLRNGDLQLLYVAPERLLMPDTLGLLQQCPLSLIAIDEAHCVSQWGHDFRPEYMRLGELAEAFPNVPRMALTATADGRTQSEIIHNLRLSNPAHYVAGFDRPNIRYHISTGSGAKDRMLDFINTHHPDDCGIVYCLSRASVEKTAIWLTQQGREAIFYHAGMPTEERQAAQDRFLKEEKLIVVATIAFGMGIDKPNVRFVAHMNLPKSVEAYYQETGRAGRDGEASNAWLNYDLSDVVKLAQWIEQSQAPDMQKRVERHKLEALLGLCEITSCRRQALLQYFGDQLPEPCGNCDNCLNPPETYDGLEIAQKALSCVFRTGQRFGAAHVIDVLRGADNERIRKFNHQSLSTYGIGEQLDNKQWRAVFRQLTARGYLRADFEAFGALKLTEKARPLLRGELAIELRREVKAAKVNKKAKAASKNLNRGQEKLFEALREKRSELASENGVPSYVIFHDAALLEMAEQRPQSLDDFGHISGVGAKKLEQYGQAFLEVVLDNPAQADDNLSSTVAQTVKLFRDGHAVSDIAGRRDQTEGTIYGHLAAAIEAQALSFEQVINLEENELQTIYAALEEHLNPVDQKMRPVFEALDGEYNYGVLQCVRQHWLSKR